MAMLLFISELKFRFQLLLN